MQTLEPKKSCQTCVFSIISLVEPDFADKKDICPTKS